MGLHTMYDSMNQKRRLSWGFHLKDHTGYKSPPAPSRPPSWLTWRRAACLLALTTLLCAMVSLTGSSERRRLPNEETVIDLAKGTARGWLTKRGSFVKNWKKRWFEFEVQEKNTTGGIRTSLIMKYYKKANSGTPQRTVKFDENTITNVAVSLENNLI